MKLSNKKLLEEIQHGIYNKTLEKEDVLEVIRKAETNIVEDFQANCEHSFVDYSGGGGYYHEKCSKCGKFKQ